MRLVHTQNEKNEIIAVFENDVLVDLYVEFPNELRCGTIVAAKALKQIDNGWFVELANSVTAFMQKSETFIRLNGDVSERPVSEGDRLIVQVEHLPVEDKDMKVTTDICLPANYFVYTPNRLGITYSKKIKDTSKLKVMLAPVSDALTVRTMAEKASLDDLTEELDELRHVWETIVAEAVAGKSVLLEPERTVFSVINKYDFSEIITDHASTALQLKNVFPKTELYLKDLREKECLETVIDDALEKKIDLVGGGSIIVEQTSAMVCVDVNAGGCLMEDVNRKAVDEILRQIRIKKLSGQMVIDFAGTKDRKKLFDLCDKLKKDDIRVVGISNLGLVELTKKRTTRSLSEIRGLL